LILQINRVRSYDFWSCHSVSMAWISKITGGRRGNRDDGIVDARSPRRPTTVYHPRNPSMVVPKPRGSGITMKTERNESSFNAAKLGSRSEMQGSCFEASAPANVKSQMRDADVIDYDRRSRCWKS
jgi:hypothetical protein